MKSNLPHFKNLPWTYKMLHFKEEPYRFSDEWDPSLQTKSLLLYIIGLHRNISIKIYFLLRSCQDTVNCTGACRTPVYCQSSRPCTSRGYCTSRVHCSNTRPPTSSSYVPKSVHATAAGGHSGTKGVRGRGGSAEKEGKPRSGPHRASTGKQLCRLIKQYC